MTWDWDRYVRYAPCLSAIILFVGLLVACLSLYVSRQSRKDAIQREKDKMTYDALKYWVENRDDLVGSISATEKFLDAVSDSALQDIFEERPLLIQNKDTFPLEILEQMKLKFEFDSKNEPQMLPSQVSKALLFHLNSLMNRLELACFPYRAGLCDRNLFYDEMHSALLRPKHLYVYQRLIDARDKWPSVRFTLTDLQRRKANRQPVYFKEEDVGSIMQWLRSFPLWRKKAGRPS